MSKFVRCLEFFCVDCCKHDDEEAHKFAKIKQSKWNDHEHISEKFESLDYEDCENVLIVEEQKRYGLPFMFYTGLQRYIILILIGITTGCFGFFVEMNVEFFSCMKFKFLNENTEAEFKNPYHVYLFMLLLCIGPAAVGSLLVLLIEPTASGGGVAGVISFLNGVRIPRLVKLRTLLVKMFSLIFAVISGLALGKEGPLVHLGTAVGATMPLIHIPFTDVRPFRYFHQDQERRDFAAAGFAAGLTAAFGTPLGGMLMVLEEGVTYWSADLTFRIFICALTSGAVYHLLLSFLKGFSGQLAKEALLFFHAVKQRTTTTFEVEEIPIFILMGAIGGILGAVWIKIQECLIIFRNRFVKTKIRKFIEILFISILTVSTGFIALLYVDECSPNDVIEDYECDPPPIAIKGYCKEGRFHTMALFMYQNGQLVLSSLFNPHYSLIDMKSLSIYVTLYFFWSAMTMGSAISAGIFVPNLITGAAWGRLMALIMHQMNPQTENWAQPNKYAFMGSAAQLSGVTRLTFSLGIIYIEATGSTKFGVPIFIMLITTKFVGMLFTESVFHMELGIRGMPVLSKSPPPLCLDVRARDVMSQDPVEWLPPVTTVGRLVDVVMNSKHNGFPVVDSSSTSVQDRVKSVGRLKGLILKSQLNSILKKRAFTSPSTPEELRETLKLFRNEFTSRLLVPNINMDTLPLGRSVDLTPYMNPHPYVVKMDASLSHTHKLFAELGLRHLIVINESYEVVGVVTRKDLAVFKKEYHYCKITIKQLNRTP